ncbi:MAG: PadR family transcriptional regulator [Intrasporangium sp.]|uniref:PadR family transcriptional regulator n=1 Tax=Intrasporangium sp. TaxID=1925024 RepID=UPI002647FBAB|nr:PadR family transcriptional regulator [Intrasporangium sp.]MDN5796353.1 PadR family transcriptional regulator [Intrasporangium sp.]
MSRRRVNNPLALAVLSCLGERPMHPYEISSTLRHRGKEQSIRLNYGSLYSVVASLEKHGLITAREKVRAGNRPERTVYEITQAGSEEFEDWLSELLSTPSNDPSSLESALSLIAGLPPDEAARLLEERVSRLDLELRALGASNDWSREQGLPEIFLVESTFREAMLAAERGYAAELAAQIRSSSLGGVKVWRRLHELRAAGTPMEEILADPVRHLGEEGRVLGEGPAAAHTERTDDEPGP